MGSFLLVILYFREVYIFAFTIRDNLFIAFL